MITEKMVEAGIAAFKATPRSKPVADAVRRALESALSQKEEGEAEPSPPSYQMTDTDLVQWLQLRGENFGGHMRTILLLAANRLRALFDRPEAPLPRSPQGVDREADEPIVDLGNVDVGRLMDVLRNGSFARMTASGQMVGTLDPPIAADVIEHLLTEIAERDAKARALPREQDGAGAVAWIYEGRDGSKGTTYRAKDVEVLDNGFYTLTPLFAHPPARDGFSAGQEAMREALTPFAEAADHMEKCHDDRPLWAALNTSWAQRDQITLTVGDLRRARTILARALPITKPDSTEGRGE